MNFERIEAAPGIFVNGFQLGESSEVCLSANILLQLEREHAAVNSLIPYILCRGTNIYDTPEKLSNRLKELGGMTLEPIVRCIGEIQCIGIRTVYSPQLSAGKDLLLRDAVQLLCSTISSPATKGGLLLSENVDAIKQYFDDDEYEPTIPVYAFNRCVEEMCCFEDYPAQIPGISTAGSYTYKKLSKRYKALLQTMPIEILYFGPAPVKAVATAVRHALSAIPRGEIDYDIGTDIRMNAVEGQVRRVSEDGFSPEAYSVIGYRIGDIMEEQPAASIQVLSDYITAFLSDIIKSEVRVLGDSHKGIFLIGAPVSAAELESTLDTLFSSLSETMPSAASVSVAAAAAADRLRSVSSEICRLEEYTLARLLDGPDCSPEEIAELAANTDSAELAKLIKSFDPDIIFEIHPSAAE